MSTPLSSPASKKSDIRRVAILFSGGPAPAANAVIGSSAVAFSRNGVEVLGIQNGYTHLMAYDGQTPLKEGVAYKKLHYSELELLRTLPGIIIGTARANPGKKTRTPEDLDDPQCTAPLKTVYEALRSLEVDALISIGGDDTLTTASKFKLFQDRLPAGSKRIRVVHLPKTIDNDYQGIDFTFGYFTAVDMLGTQIRNLMHDGQAAGAYFFVQVMGRKAGWLAYGASIAGDGSLAVSLEDIPPDWWTTEPTRDPKSGELVRDEETGEVIQRKVVKLEPLVSRLADTIVAREKEGKRHGVIIFAEGLGEYLPLDELQRCIPREQFEELKADSFGHFPVSQLKFTGRLAQLVNQALKDRRHDPIKINPLQFGYEVRCHQPTAFDIILGSQLGVGSYRALVEEGLDGVMVSVGGQLSLVYERFEDLIDMQRLRAHARLIDPNEDFHQLARYLESRVD